MRHGTTYGYCVKRCRCDACTAANRAAGQRFRDRRRAERIASGWTPPQRTHGLRSAYRDGCRCRACTDAATAYIRERRAMKRAA